MDDIGDPAFLFTRNEDVREERWGVPQEMVRRDGDKSFIAALGKAKASRPSRPLFEQDYNDIYLADDVVLIMALLLTAGLNYWQNVPPLSRKSRTSIRQIVHLCGSVRP